MLLLLRLQYHYTELTDFAVDHDFAVAATIHRKVTAKIHSEIDSVRLT